jgi:SWI/SNF-related matrix-associated actin-dependent regulator of chromatin subfamily A3
MVFRKHVALPFERGLPSATAKLRQLLDSLCLRRKTHLLNLPDIVEVSRELSMAPEEQLQYDTTSKLMEQALKQRASKASDKSTPFGLFQAQLQLRILCNHGTFQKQFSWGLSRDFLVEREDAEVTFGQNGEVKCSSCREIMPILSTARPDVDARSCGHVLCPECAFQHADMSGKGGFVSGCRLCDKGGLQVLDWGVDDRIEPHSQGNSYFNNSGFSTKMAAIMADLAEDQFSSKRSVFASQLRIHDLTFHLTVSSFPAGQGL